MSTCDAGTIVIEVSRYIMDKVMWTFAFKVKGFSTVDLLFYGISNVRADDVSTETLFNHLDFCRTTVW